MKDEEEPGPESYTKYRKAAAPATLQQDWEWSLALYQEAHPSQEENDTLRKLWDFHEKITANMSPWDPSSAMWAGKRW